MFVHGDVWWGNTRWDGDACLALIDWKDAGAGNPGVDLGNLRLQMALTYGPDTPEQVLDGWQRESGLGATDLPYWDAVAALNTPAVLAGWPGFDRQGNRLDALAVTKRRDAFLRGAIDRPGRTALGLGPAGRRSQVTADWKMLPTASLRAVSNSSSVCSTDNPSVRAREKLAITPWLRASRSSASSRE